ncbi:MAG: GIY-YIG nuclease family protein [Leucobacter sp.]|nr:GIY-YIG nuclease family protein [Leucobacter sp.]
MISETEWTPDFGVGEPIIGRVYAFRSTRDGEVRYVGQTTKSLLRRRGEHRAQARRGRKTPFYSWLRKQNAEDYEVISLEAVAGDRELLGEAEEAWITLFRNSGDRLLNLTEGGLGPKGVQWTDGRRKEMSERNKGRKGVSLPGSLNPMWGRSHSEEQKRRWSQQRKGTNAGVNNVNYGKFGAEHPAYGRKLSSEARKLLSEQRQGEKNPNFGKTASGETRAKMSAAQKGVPKPSSVRSAHTRYHTNMNVFKDSCRHCLDDAAQNLDQ